MENKINSCLFCKYYYEHRIPEHVAKYGKNTGKCTHPCQGLLVIPEFTCLLHQPLTMSETKELTRQLGNA